MRKERNNFFQESGYNQGYFYNNMTPQFPAVPQMEASSSFYMNQGMNQDVDSRLSKLERQVNKLESRINKLETQNQQINNDDTFNNNNMYMI
ncbi:MAG: hypothetical protein K6G37_02475 [Bacilli bacterium]|nr:hypothetical protein [Bacilli bacterium]